MKCRKKEQEELKKDIQAFVKELLAFGAVRRELGSPDGTCAGELKIAGIPLLFMEKRAAFQNSLLLLRRKEERKKQQRKQKERQRKKQEKKKWKKTDDKNRNRQDAADLTLELIEHVRKATRMETF